MVPAGAQYRVRRGYGKNRNPSYIGRRCLTQPTISCEQFQTPAPQDPSSGEEQCDVSMADASPTPSRPRRARRIITSGDLRRESTARINEHLPSGAVTASDIDTLRQEIRQEMQQGKREIQDRMDQELTTLRNLILGGGSHQYTAWNTRDFQEKMREKVARHIYHPSSRPPPFPSISAISNTNIISHSNPKLISFSAMLPNLAPR